MKMKKESYHKKCNSRQKSIKYKDKIYNKRLNN
jgi:hypothetical protein